MIVDPLAIVALTEEIWIRFDNIKVYRERCKALISRCKDLANALRGGTENTPPCTDTLQDALEILQDVREKGDQWANLTWLKSLLAQGDICEGVDILHRRIDTCMQAYYIRSGREFAQDVQKREEDARKDRRELLKLMRALLQMWSQNADEQLTYGRESSPPAVADEFVQGLAEEISSLSSHDRGDTIKQDIRAFCASLETLHLTPPADAGDPTGGHLVASTSSSSGQPTHNTSPFMLEPSLSRLRKLSNPSTSSLSYPDIPPLNFEHRESGSSNILPSKEPDSNPPDCSDVLSVLNNSNSSNLSPFLIAVTIYMPVWLYGSSGEIKRATMEGLVRYLLLHPEDTGQHDTFFIGRPPCISVQDVLNILVRQYADPSGSPGNIDDIRPKIMCLLKRWLDHQHVFLTHGALGEMNRLVADVNGSDSLKLLALEVMQGIRDKVLSNLPSPIHFPCNSTADMKPVSARLLAIALTALEGERYQRIHATEYIACAAGDQKRSTSNYPNLQEAIILHERIASWVQSCMIRSENRKTRSEISGYFIETAKCLKSRNFSSMYAILSTLQSDAVNCPDPMKKVMTTPSRNSFQELGDLFNPESNYGAYKAARRRKETRGCIPWHGAHLQDVQIVLGEKDVDENQEPPLLNFDKWTRLKETAMEPLRYRDAQLQKMSMDMLLGIPHNKDSKDDLRRVMGHLNRILQGGNVDDDCSSWFQMKTGAPKGRKRKMQRTAAVRAVGFG